MSKSLIAALAVAATLSFAGAGPSSAAPVAHSRLLVSGQNQVTTVRHIERENRDGDRGERRHFERRDRDHDGDEHRHFNRRNFLFYNPIIVRRYAADNDGCYWLRRKAANTGSRYWWHRYNECRWG